MGATGKVRILDGSEQETSCDSIGEGVMKIETIRLKNFKAFENNVLVRTIRYIVSNNYVNINETY